MKFKQWFIETAREISHGTYPEDISPIQQGEQFRVYHGFYNPDDAVNIAKHGTSGKLRAKRVYSYESENNPKGLFVTLDKNKIASRFAGGQKVGVIMEFIANESDLKPPVWPGGGYTTQGQMAQYFYQDARGSRLARNAKIQDDEEEARKSPYPSVSQSHRPGLAQTLFGSEMQALFVGDLNPDSIVKFWIQEPEEGVDYRVTTSEWKPISREEFIEKFDTDKKAQYSDNAKYRTLSPEDDFNWQKSAEWYNNKYGAMDHKEQIRSEEDFYRTFIGALVHGKMIDALRSPREFERLFDNYFWPKQIPQLYQWTKKMYRKYGDPYQ